MVTKSQFLTKFNVTESRLHCTLFCFDQMFDKKKSEWSFGFVKLLHTYYISIQSVILY